MRVLTTPDEAFRGLPEYPFERHALDVGGLDMHYVREGPAEGPIVMLMHGQPSWSFLYRRTIADLAAAGYRVYAPDLIGFLRSDKPDDPTAYTYPQHVESVQRFIRKLDLAGVSLVLHDWGGLIGLRVVAADPERFARIVASNTALVDGSLPMPEAWVAFRDKVAADDPLCVSDLARGFCLRPLTDATAAAYDAPFPTEAHKTGVRAFPTLVPVSADDPNSPAVRDAWKVLEAFDRPFLTIFGSEDRIYAGVESLFLGRVPGTRGQPHVELKDAGHFLQEDRPEAFSRALLAFLGSGKAAAA